MKVYVCASFCYSDKVKTEKRKRIIEDVVNRISNKLSADFYIPHQLKIPNAWDISMEEWGRAVYNHDIAALDAADLVIFLSFGKENNSGSVWECGYAYAKGTKIVMIKMTEEVESLMLFGSIDRIITEKEIESYDWTTLPKYVTSIARLG